MLKLPIYLDNNSTTPMDPRVLEAMMPYLTDVFGNSASRNHPFGWAAEEGVDYAREQIAALINCDSKEIIFTSGATESDNLGIKGVFEMYSQKGNTSLPPPPSTKPYSIPASTSKSRAVVLLTCPWTSWVSSASKTWKRP